LTESVMLALKEKYSYNPPTLKMHASEHESKPESVSYLENDSESEEVHYPLTAAQRAAYRTRLGKRVTDHQWAVYDYTSKIPRGKVTTYKAVCDAIGQGSPRSVGNALRANPFAPTVPCHRVVASSLFIGGFVGEWGPEGGTGIQCKRKMDILAREGVRFSSTGFLVDAEDVLWQK